MSVGIGGISASTPGSSPSYAAVLQTPQVQLATAQASEDASLFGGGGTDLLGLASTAAAFSLYRNPGLLMGLTQWDGSATPGSQRAPQLPDPSPSKGSFVDALA